MYLAWELQPHLKLHLVDMNLFQLPMLLVVEVIE